LKQERYAEAVTLFDHLIANNPDRADFWLLQANAYIGLNQPLKAATNYELIDRMGESTVGSLNMLGDIYINQQLFGIAVNSYIRALEKNPQGKPERAIRAAKVLTAHSALAETKRLIERIESLHSRDLDTADRKDLLKLRARIAVAEGSGEEEVKVLEEIVALDPLDGEALILLGQYSRRSEDFEKAIFYYERAESLEKYEADAKVRHAQLLVGQGKYAEALPLLRRAQAIKPREDVQKYLEQVERVSKSR
jgi:tetratricopeptide (TPR) repeat protein